MLADLQNLEIFNFKHYDPNHMLSETHGLVMHLQQFHNFCIKLMVPERKKLYVYKDHLKNPYDKK